jgi:hypothetical protein
MGHSIAIHPYRFVARPGGKGHGWRFRFVIVLLLAAAIASISHSLAVPVAEAVQTELMKWKNPEPANVQFPARELARAWRQGKLGADVDHMYYRTPSPQHDWIRKK